MAAFVKHAACPKCNSSDANAIYEDGSSYCWSCQAATLSDEYKEELGARKKKIRTKTIKEPMAEEEIKSTKPAITEDQKNDVKKETGTAAKKFRGIDDDISKYFGVRYAYDESTGAVTEQYYPCTQASELVGYKIRTVPKDFYSIARTGADCELFGQFRFQSGGKYILITEGELDALSAYQMIKRYNDARNSTFEIAVVSPTTGAQSKKQISRQYKFFDSFENIIISYDGDPAGQSAVEELIKVLPKGKVKVMPMSYKDANVYLEGGHEAKFIRDFYNAKKQIPVNVLPSGNLYDRILQQSEVQKVPFPPFMRELNEIFVGGMPLGHIINIAADTGVGKTTLVNEMIYFWVFHSPHRIGIVSMELDAGQYGEALLSRHLSKKLALIPTMDEKLQYLRSDRVKEQSNILMLNESGDDRFYLLDNRDGTIEEIQDTVEELVVSCNCKVIILDPLQDILDGLSNEEQALFMKWSKGFQKSHNVLFVFINHMRKAENSGEQDIMGSSTIIKSASANILLKRDKLATDPILRNTTQIFVPKNRVYGITGPAGGAYYDNATHTLHNLQDWMKENGPDNF
jgi:twinkle protein